MKKKFIIAGNWKMHKTVEESIFYVKELDKRIVKNEKVDILIFPPFTSIYALKGISDKIKCGSQNIYFEEKGAYTGEISPVMLKNLVDYVLIGHSERRQLFKETDEDINKKIKTAFKNNLNPIICIGETLEERNQGKTFSKIKNQINMAFSGLNTENKKRIILAYEPIWAIGTGKNATPEQAQETHIFIRKFLKEKINKTLDIPILYGGSVNPENSYNLLSQKDIDGVLVGGASLNIDTFFGIIQNSYKVLNN